MLKEILKVVDNENLVGNVRDSGDVFLNGLKQLQVGFSFSTHLKLRDNVFKSLRTFHECVQGRSQAPILSMTIVLS